MAEIHEFVRAKRIGFDDAAPAGIDGVRSLVARADAVSPVIFVCVTTTRPAENWQAHVFQRRNNIIANTASIGDRRIFADPYPVINAAAQMFSKISVDILVDDSFGLIGANS